MRNESVRNHSDDHQAGVSGEELYARRLAGLLRFGTLEEAEDSFRKLDEIYQEYRSVSDRIGTSEVRSLVTHAKRRAESLVANSRLKPEARAKKVEIARWCKVWLDVSDLFFDWLETRKQAEDFRRLFLSGNGRGNGKGNGHGRKG